MNFGKSELVRLNTSITMLYIYIWLGIQRFDGPGRHKMLTVINAYYGYCYVFSNIKSCMERNAV